MVAARKKKKALTVRAIDKPFYTPAMMRWMCNYQPVIAPRMCRQRSEAERSRTSMLMREEQAASNIGWGSGAVPGISAKADARLRSLPARFLVFK